MSAVRLDVVLLRDARMHTSTNGDAVLELMVSRYAAGSVPMLLQQVVGRGFAAQHACSAAAARLRRGTAVQVWGDCIGYDRVRRCLVVTGVDHISPLAGAPDRAQPAERVLPVPPVLEARASALPLLSTATP